MQKKIDFIIFILQKKLVKILAAFIIKRRKRSVFHRNTLILITKKYLKKYLYSINNLKGKDGGKIPKIIWVCWIQGFENAPKVVQSCITSIKNHSKEYTVNIITDANIKQFVDIPEYIYNKRASGNMSNTHFSDILRVFLLSKHGGIWVDSTVFLTDSLPKEITSGSFFCFHAKNILNNNNNWIIASSKDHKLTNGIKTLLLEYWKHEKTAVHYFIFHIFFDLMVENNQHLNGLWQNVPVLCDGDYYNLPFSKKSSEKNTIHKLNHRANYDSELQLGAAS
ncbi:MAG: mannosyltransferase OCH1-like enzyme [Rickettsiales bacterium]|jgi:mannosyltransferase OCH1-like enzyme